MWPHLSRLSVPIRVRVDPSMDTFAFDRLVICGIGLIGGSVARGLRRAHADGRSSGAGQIVGVDRDAASLARAVDLGLIDVGYAINDFEAAVTQADFIVLATPVAQTRALLSRLMSVTVGTGLPILRPDAVLTDVGSTKGDIVSAAQHVLGEQLARFVPAHPIAGAEASGVDASYASLFDGRDAILCPLGATAEDALARTQVFWQCLGARPVVMAAERHDALFASVSHLPHLLAFAFIAHILKSDDAECRFAFAGSGFRDFSRIAASSPEMWRDICEANRDAILSDMDGFLAQLGRLREAIAQGDTVGLEALFSLARDARSDWHQGETLAARALRHSTPGITAKAVSAIADAPHAAADVDSANGSNESLGPLVP